MARRRNNKQEEEVLFDVAGAAEQTQDFVERNQNYIFGGLAALVLVIGGYFAYKNLYQIPREKEASNMLFQAEQRFEQDSFVAALNAPGAGYKGFISIADDYSGTKAGNLANYYAGLSYLHIGDYEAALVYLKDFDAVGQITPATRYSAIGDAYAEMQNMDDALSYYKKAVNAVDNEAVTPMYMDKLAKCYMALGQMDKAQDTYTELKELYPTTSWGKGADKYLGYSAK